MLLVVVLITAIFSISLGLFNIVFGELWLSGEIADSFIASFAASQGIERALYLDRVLGSICETELPCAWTETKDSTNGFLPSNVCYNTTIEKSRAENEATTTSLIVVGQYRCGPETIRVVKRAFEWSY